MSQCSRGPTFLPTLSLSYIPVSDIGSMQYIVYITAEKQKLAPTDQAKSNKHMA